MQVTLDTSIEAYRESLHQRTEVFDENGNPGRGGEMGIDEAGNLVVSYFFGGRSDGSKNRQAIYEGSAIRLIAPGMTAEEMAQKPDAALVYYHAMDSKDGVFVVSNGAQTRPVLDAMVEGASLEEAMTNAPIVKGMMKGEEVDIDLSRFEPDEPHETPRFVIAADLRAQAVTQFGLGIVRKDPETGDPKRMFYTANLEDIPRGTGWGIQTYNWNDPGDKVTPVPSFDQAPYAFSMRGDSTEIARRVREGVGERTFAAAIVRVVNVETQQFQGGTIINTRG